MIDHTTKIFPRRLRTAIQEAKEIAFNPATASLPRPDGLTKQGRIDLNLTMLCSAQAALIFEAEIEFDRLALSKRSSARLLPDCARKEQNNIVKHSQAQKAVLRMERDDENLTSKSPTTGGIRTRQPAKNDLCERAWFSCELPKELVCSAENTTIESKTRKGHEHFNHLLISDKTHMKSEHFASSSSDGPAR